MSPPSPTAFGKRDAPRRDAARRDAARVADAAPLDHAAFFAAVRAELDEAAGTKPFVVPRSFTAALLAGLVVGCALAGFDVTGHEGADRVMDVAGALGLPIDTTHLLPALILLGLLGGARVAALTMLVVQTALHRADLTHHAAYAAGGALASAALAGLLAAVGHPSADGWAFELLAGAGAGLLYRVFAGTRRAP